jgi:hypothetical protein
MPCWPRHLAKLELRLITIQVLGTIPLLNKAVWLLKVRGMTKEHHQRLGIFHVCPQGSAAVVANRGHAILSVGPSAL